MAEDLSKRLNELGIVLTTQAANVEVSSLLQDVFNSSLHVPSNEAVHISVILFNDNTGILKILKTAVPFNSSKFETFKINIIRFLAEYCQEYGERNIVQYITTIKDTVMSVFACDSSLKVKTEVVLFVTKALHLPEVDLKDRLDVPNLIKRFWSECLRSARAGSIFRGDLYNLMGVFAKLFPEQMFDVSDRFQSMLLNWLKLEMESKKKKPELLVVAGCLNGLNGYLVNFEGSKHSSDILKYIEKSIIWKEYKRYDVPKAALNLISHHCVQFKELLIPIAQVLYDALEFWSNHLNNDVRKIAIRATDSFLEELSLSISEKGKIDECMSTLKGFMQSFYNTLNSSSASAKQVSMAIKGFGKLSKACSVYFSEEEMKLMFQEMIKRSEQVCGNVESMHHLPTYLEALANMVKNIKGVSNANLDPVEQIVIASFEYFPNLGKTGQEMFKKGLILFIDGVSWIPDVFSTSVSKLIYQCLIRTCSHQPKTEIDVEQVEEFAEKKVVVTYKTFLPVWKHLLEEQSYRVSLLTELERCKVMKEHIYDKIIEALLAVLQKLDFNTQKKSEDDIPSSDPTRDLVASIPNDFLIFVNLVDLFSELLHFSVSSFRRWTISLVETFTLLSMRYPLVSGFYKLVRLACVLIEENAYFEIVQSLKCSTSEENERKFIENSLVAYSKEVVARTIQYKEDLLLSCLQLLMALPTAVLKTTLMSIVPAFKMAFHLGLSHFVLAEQALCTLERLNGKLPKETFKAFLHSVLPCLDDYLQPSVTGDESEERVELTKTERKIKRVPIRYLRALIDASKRTVESPLMKIKHRIVNFLGCLGGDSNIAILHDDGNLNKAINWDTTEHLEFALPFRDMKPTIYLDRFLPHVIDLCLSSSDRQVRVISCEVLHALVIFMLGKDAQHSTSKRNLGMEKLYRKIFPALLRLSCSHEQVSEQLFSPLVFQMIHWFTGNTKHESPETMALLDALIDGTASPTDSWLRDFSAKCIKEFLDWSIKQSSPKQVDRYPGNPKSLFKRLYSFISHPSAFKRLGGAIIFNNIYDVFREEESLVSSFALEMLLLFVNGLALSHSLYDNEEQSLGIVEQFKLSLQHLEKIIKKKSSVLLKPSKDRRIPVEFKDVKDVFNLHHVNIWLLRQCGAPQTACRHACMKLICSFLLLQDGARSVEEFMAKTMEGDKGAGRFSHKFESGGSDKDGIRFSTTPEKRLKRVFSAGVMATWFENLLGALDCYCWVLGARFLTASKLFIGNNTTKLFEALEYFICEISLICLKELSHKYGENETILKQSDCDNYDRLKCTVVVRTLNFLTITLLTGLWQEAGMMEVAAKIFSTSFMELLVVCLFSPQDIGFNMLDNDVCEKLPDELLNFCAAFIRASSEQTELFVNTLTSRLQNDAYSFHVDQGLMSTPHLNCVRLKQLLNGYAVIEKCGLFEKVVSTEVRESMSTGLLDCLVKIKGSETKSVLPAQKLLGDQMLKLYLQLNPLKKLFTILFGENGMKFYHVFSQTIVAHLNANQSTLKDFLEHQSSWSNLHTVAMIGVVSSCEKDKDTKVSSAVCKEIVSHVTGINKWMNVSRERELLGLNLLDLCLTHYKGCLVSPNFFTIFITILKNTTNDLTAKEKVMEALPMLLAHSDPQQCNELKESLVSLVARDFPMSSNDFSNGSSKLNEYTSCLKKLLKALVSANDSLLFEVLSCVFIKETEDVYNELILPSLLAFIKRSTSKEIKKVLDYCLKVAHDCQSYTNEFRATAVDRLCLPILNAITWYDLREFFTKNILIFTNIISAKFTKHPESTFESELFNKIFSFKIVSLMYELLGKNEVFSNASSIVKAFDQNLATGKELTSFLSKATSAAYKENMCGEVVLVELRRKFHCAAYNCLISIISCTQTEQKFYAGLLFAEKPAKGELVLENLVDLQREYTFEADFAVPLRKQKAMQLIRQAASNNSKINVNEKGVVSYFSTQYLMQSSLSQDVNQYDFNSPIDAYTHYQMPANTNETKQENNVAESETIIELDELNRHECMNVMLALIAHMRNTKVYQQPAEGSLANEMPLWMVYLHKKMNSSEKNVKLFVAKIVANDFKTFEPYGKFWFSPLAELILSGEIKGAPLNYFVVDLIIAMLSWSSTIIPEDTVIGRNLASSILDYALQHCRHNNKSVLKNNLQIIKTITNVWKDRLEISYQHICTLFQGRDEKTKDNMAGLHILGGILANGFAPFKSSLVLSEDQFYADLSRNLNFHYKDVFATCSEVCGLAFKYLQLHNKAHKSSLLETTQNYLLQFSKTSNKDKFVTCIHHIHVHYPEIVDSFIPQLLYCVRSMFGLLKTQCIQCLAARVAQLPDEHSNIYAQFKGTHLDELLQHKDEEAQLATLQLVQGLLLSLSVNDTLLVLPKVLALQHDSSAKIRGLVQSIFMWVYDHYRGESQMENDDQCLILSMTKDVLLIGINDPNTDLSLKLLNFWQSESRLPDKTLDRLIEILHSLYSSKTEKDFLSYSTNLLLQLTSLSPDYTLPLFNTGLDEETNFRNYHVNFSWQRQNISMTPLFVATQQSNEGSYSFTQGGSHLEGGMLRATQQNLEFTQTQQLSSSIDWMNPTVQIAPESIQQRTSTQSSGQFDVGTKQPNSESNVLRLKQRFMKDTSARNAHFANREIKRQKLRDATLERQKVASDRKVVMYRKYRVGELPDIKIKHSELIVPLQALAQLDHNIAQLLFQTIFTAILSQFPSDQSIQDIDHSLKTMMQTSTIYNPAFVFAIQSICYEHEEFSLDAQTVTNASVTSLQQPVGIMLLEKQILKAKKSLEPQLKRCRTSLKANIIEWSELAKMYDSIEDYDQLRSVFSGQISTSPFTKEALSAEAKNDFQAALTIYRQAASTNGNNDEEEEEYWDNARMKCYKNLGMWTKLKDFTVMSLEQITESKDSIMKIWSDDKLQKVHLPYYIQSNLKLLCQGKLDDVHETFNEFIEMSLNDETWKEHLQARFSVELALLKVLHDNYGGAQHFLNIAAYSFLRDWCQMSKLLPSSRTSILAKLQQVSEMKDFVALMTSEGAKNSTEVRQFVNKWSTRLPSSKVHSTTVWNDVVLSRCAFLRKLKQNFSSESDMCEFLDEHETRNILKIANIAVKQGNFSMAALYLKDSSNITENGDVTALSTQWHHVYAKVHCAKFYASKGTSNVDGLVSAANKLEKYSTQTEEMSLVKQKLLEHDVHSCLIGCLELNLDSSLLANLAKLHVFDMAPVNRKECVDAVHHRAWSSLNDAVGRTKSFHRENELQRKLKIKALLKMFKYSNERVESDNGGVTFVRSMVSSLLEAMALDSMKARLLFPRLLQLLASYPEVGSLFEQKSQEVPCWMFLGWINQIVSLINSPVVWNLKSILNKIARSYKQALVYSLKVSGEQFTFADDEQGNQQNEYFKRLLSHVHMPQVDLLTDSLCQLTEPTHVVQSVFGELEQDLLKQDHNKILTRYKLFQDQYLCAGSEFNGLPKGKFEKDFAKIHGKLFESVLGKDGKKMIGMPQKEFLQTKKKLLNAISGKCKGTLKDFSPWLSDFQMRRFPELLEIPGQYTGQQKPMSEYHVKIAGFDQEVMIMSSIRRPKRITIRGDDKKEYKFLVKGGEDLRQDQRIEQIFELMNKILQNDPDCSNRDLNLTTYQVVPMSPKVGLIKWVENTLPYQDLLFREMNEHEKKSFDSSNGPRNKHDQFIKKYGNYVGVYTKANRSETVKYFQERENTVPWDLLRRAFEKLSSTCETYFMLRKRFIQSHSCMCIAHYVLGIGDRHLNNTLIDLTSGGVVGIDFGHAFGTATQLLSQPELVPFRLTRQMLNLLLPLEDPSPYKQCMVAVLRTLRKHAHVLLNTMDVFINEPLLDWQKYGSRMEKQNRGAMNELGRTCWYPKQKILICKKKLNGVNPAYITREELRSSIQKDANLLKSLVCVLEGSREHNIRKKKLLEQSANPEHHFLTAEEQVDCLVDQATDPNILGRAYVGWFACV